MANILRQIIDEGPFTVLDSAARIATPDTQEFEVLGAETRGLHLVVDVTAVTLTPSITVTILGVDRLSGKTSSAAITATGTTVLKVAPGLTAAANTVANDLVPPIFRIQVAHGDADSITYSVAGQLVG